MAAIFDPEGTASTPQGFTAGAVYAGMKTYGEESLDVALLLSDRPCAVAATYTKNVLHSASVDINRAKLMNPVARAIVVNAGIANSSTGQRGYDDGQQVTGWVAERFGIDADEVLICSTGVIGHFLPMEKMQDGVARVTPTDDGGLDFARAIMTTDMRPKYGAVRFGPYTLGGTCKGSGMIHPNMATMLAFLTTDAPIEQGFMQRCVSAAVDKSFNLVSIDGDTSPSDTVLLLANGAAGGETLTAAHPLAGEFQEALEMLCVHLAKEIARDGEGATKVIEVTVSGAATQDDARSLVRLMTTSYLLKSAVHGADPNWGRIVSVAGRSGVQLSEDLFSVDLCGVRVFEKAEPTAFDEHHVTRLMQGETVNIDVDLGVGTESATGWGCDLSAEYVSINADYHT